MISVTALQPLGIALQTNVLRSELFKCPLTNFDACIIFFKLFKCNSQGHHHDAHWNTVIGTQMIFYFTTEVFVW